MIQEEKQLLLIDLYARLLYGVKVQYNNEIYNIDYISTLYEEVKLDIPDNYTIGISEIKPYLRPMSSMTEEEKEEFENFVFPSEEDENGNYQTGVLEKDIPNYIDWLNKKMFDFRGLIPKDLAISTEVFNPYKD